jgi:F-type H+-transporting ATPase subunit b
MEALGLNLPMLIAQIVGFLVLLYILSKLLYRPLLKVMDERADRIKESLEAAERAKEQAAASQEQMQEDIRKAREEGQQMIAQARDVASRFRDEEMAKAREEISAERAKAEADIQRERDAAIEDLRQEFAGLAISAAERVVERSLSESDHRNIIDRVLEESGTIGKG